MLGTMFFTIAVVGFASIILHVMFEKGKPVKKVIHLDEEDEDEFWEILVPASSKDKEFTYEHHKKWDEYVKSLAGGLTVMKTAKGEWISKDGKLFVDRMIPVKIKCSYADINKIIDFTMEHYDQEAVLAYRISSHIILRNRSDYEYKPL